MTLEELKAAAEKRDQAAREYDLAWERVKKEADRVGEIMNSGGIA